MSSDNLKKFFYGNHASQFGVLRVPDLAGKLPVVITIHGGFWRSPYGMDELEKMAQDFTLRGYATWNIEYRRIGEAGGGWTGTFSDVVSAVNYLSQLSEQYPLDLSRVIILGHSAGGHLALWLAARGFESQADNLGESLLVPIRGVVSLAGVTDLRRMWEIHNEKGIDNHVAALVGGTPDEVPDRYNRVSPIELLPSKIDQFLIHGDSDLHVPLEISVDYQRKAVEQGGNVQLKVLPGADHFQIIDPSSSVWSAVTDAVKLLAYSE